MSALRAALVVVALLAAGCGGSEKKPEPREKPAPAAAEPEMPFNPFSDAEVGDWSITVVRSGHDRIAEPGSALRTYRVTAVEGDKVSIETETVLLTGKRIGPTLLVFPRTGALTISAYARTSRPLDVKIGSEMHEGSGRRFACREVLFRSREGDAVAHTTLLIHPDVKGLGLVSAKTMTRAPTEASWTDEELAGYGTARETLWGRSESDLLRPAPASGSPPSTFRDAASGVSVTLPAFAPLALDEASIPFTFRLEWLQVQAKVTRTRTAPTRDALRAEIVSQAATAGLELTREREVPLEEVRGVVYELSSATARLLYLAVLQGETGWFLTVTTGARLTESQVATVEEILMSFRLGQPTESGRAKPGRAVYCDGLHGFRVELPSDKGAVFDARFWSAPILGAVSEAVEVAVSPPRTQDELVGLLTNGLSTIARSETKVSDQPAALLELEAAPPNGSTRAARILALVVGGERRSVLVTCSCPADGFESRRAAFRACLESVAIGR